MDVRILYLDIDDEITTAANRVREADATIAIVLPYGSRVATSRINFRLLCAMRRSTASGLDRRRRRGDAGLAASAGLPIFATVASTSRRLAAGWIKGLLLQGTRRVPSRAPRRPRP